ncbi:hypothetical protein Hanom_Chr16g01464861 [Helianthus anomalus]
MLRGEESIGGMVAACGERSFDHWSLISTRFVLVGYGAHEKSTVKHARVRAVLG